MTSCAAPSRRKLIVTGVVLMGAGLVSLSMPHAAQAQNSTATPQNNSALSDQIAAEFLGGATPAAEGLELELPVLSDNPAAVPTYIRISQPMTNDSYCEEIILLAEHNPMPLACRFRFTAASGAAEVGVRLRLIETMHIRALARMSDGRFLEARQEITVAAGGCGM